MNLIKFKLYTDPEIVPVPALYDVIYIDYTTNLAAVEDHLTSVQDSIELELYLGPNGHPYQHYHIEHECKIIQYTNCLDSNNNEIFEGFIVAYHFTTETKEAGKSGYTSGNIGVLLEVKSIIKNDYSLHTIINKNGCFGFNLNNVFIPLYTQVNSNSVCQNLTIMGNYFENPELIPKQDIGIFT